MRLKYARCATVNSLSINPFTLIKYISLASSTAVRGLLFQFTPGVNRCNQMFFSHSLTKRSKVQWVCNSCNHTYRRRTRHRYHPKQSVMTSLPRTDVLWHASETTRAVRPPLLGDHVPSCQNSRDLIRNLKM